MRTSLIRPRTAVAALLAATALGAGGAAVVATAVDSDGGTATREVTVTSAQPAAQSNTLSVHDVYERAHAGVVEITVSSPSEATPFGGSQQEQSQGSGFVYDRQGHLITNQHVIDGAESVSVKFSNGSTYKATVVGSDASTDMAVIKVDAPASLLTPISLGDSSKVEVGDGVVAIGSPFGLDQTVTSGIVSALHRQMTAPNKFTINDSIQTDAAINHGNSGGPLLNLRGQVIGVNAQIESSSNGDNAGVGFAIPSNTVRAIANQLIENGNVEHAYLGVGVDEIPESAAAELDVPAGVALRRVNPGTPAAEAGLQGSTGTRVVDGQPYPIGGDVVTAIDGRQVRTAAELQSAIDAKRPGDTVTLTYTRGGREHTAKVKLATRPQQAS
jgi:S1-C subfamily serine protease